jgi:rare lipoprotein A (peptidoglycan hydrolase)
MANGRSFDPNGMNAAMVDVPLGTKVTVTSIDNPTKVYTGHGH